LELKYSSLKNNLETKHGKVFGENKQTLNWN